MKLQSILMVLFLVLGANTAWAKSKKKEEKKDHPKSQVEVRVVNSPVSGNEAIFEIETPLVNEISKITYQLKAKKETRPRNADFVIKDANKIELKVSTIYLKEGEYQIKFNLYKKKGKKEEQLFGKDQKHWLSFVVKKEIVVVDPGEEGKKTLLGIDVDNNGVRDDVQIWINKNFDDDLFFNESLMSLARAYQYEFMNVDNIELSKAMTHKKMDAYKCALFRGKQSGLTKVSQILAELKKQFLNTKDRIQTSMKVSNNFHGEIVEVVVGADEERSCN